MSGMRVALLGMGCVAVLASAPFARAVDIKAKTGTTDFSEFTNDDAPLLNQWSPRNQVKALQWNAKGRWGLKVNVAQPQWRDVEWKDVEAGAFYRLTHHLNIGGSVGLGDPAAPDRTQTPDEKSAPRVKLETTFKF